MGITGGNDSAMEVDTTPSPEEPPPQASRALAPDSWEDTADDETTTPDGDEDEDGDAEEHIARIKKKPARPEETKSKKEHINVVFIGHVGKNTKQSWQVLRKECQ